MKIRIIIILLISVFAAACSKSLIIKDITTGKPGIFMYGKTPERNFYYDVNIGGLTEVWEESTKGGYDRNSFTIYDTYLFAADRAGNITVMDRLTGDEAGTVENDGEIPVTPLIHGLKVFYTVNLSEEPGARLYSYDYHNKDKKEILKIGGSSGNELTGTEEALYVLTNNGILYKVSYRGRKQWETDTETETYSDPAYYEGKVYFGNSDGELIAVNGTNGKIEWKKKVADYINTGITIDAGKGYAGDRKGTVYCFDTSGGEVLWEFSTGHRMNTEIVYDGNNVYVTNLNGDIFSLDKETGREVWKKSVDGIFNSAPVVTANKLVVPDYKLKVYIMEKSSGEITDTLKLQYRTATTPVIFDGYVYVGTDKGPVHCYKIAGRGKDE